MSGETLVTIYAQINRGETYEFGTVEADTEAGMHREVATLLRRLASEFDHRAATAPLSVDAARWTPTAGGQR